MAIVYQKGHTLTSDDLSIKVRDSGNALIDPYSITYGMYHVSETGDTLFGSPTAEPVRLSLGIFYPDWVIPSDAPKGEWYILWSISKEVGSPIETVRERFGVVEDLRAYNSMYSSRVSYLLKSIRILLRDNNPDRNYHFRPPRSPEEVQMYNKEFGYIWTDEELYYHILTALDQVNQVPPENHFRSIEEAPKYWDIIFKMAGAKWALFSVTTNWVAEEFHYSIGGISLDISKANAYQSLFESLSTQVADLLESTKSNGAKRHTVGLMHSKFLRPYGVGNMINNLNKNFFIFRRLR